MLDHEKLKDDLIELHTNRVLEIQFESKTLQQNWCLAMDMFPKLYEKALCVLIPFVTIHLCESGFSALLSIKTKSKNRLSAQADMQVAISNKVPRFEKLLSNKPRKRVYKFEVPFKFESFSFFKKSYINENLIFCKVYAMFNLLHFLFLYISFLFRQYIIKN